MECFVITRLDCIWIERLEHKYPTKMMTAILMIVSWFVANKWSICVAIYKVMR